MKRIKFLVLVFLLGIILAPIPTLGAETNDVAINQDNFSNYHMKRIATNMDSNKDGVLSQAEAEKLTDIDADWSNGRSEVLDLTGIEYFTNLKSLTIRNENLSTSFDFSKLPKSLESIWIEDCQISVFQLGELPNLNKVVIKNTSVNTVDISKLNSLKEIELYNTDTQNIIWGNKQQIRAVVLVSIPLSVLDITQMKNLDYLYLHDLNITNLNLKKSKKLERMSLHNLPVKQIDLTNCNKIKKLSLRNISISNLDLSKYSKMDYIDVFNSKSGKLYWTTVDKVVYGYTLSKNKKEVTIHTATTYKKWKKIEYPSKIDGKPVTKIGGKKDSKNYYSTTIKCKKLVIPKSVKTLSRECFKGLKAEQVVLPNSIKKIPAYCFKSSTIKKIKLPKKLKKIGEGAFYKCKKLKSITIPKSTKKIGVRAFKGCKKWIKA